MRAMRTKSLLCAVVAAAAFAGAPGFAWIDVPGVNPGIDEPFENCAADGLGTVMHQVRAKRSDAYARSSDIRRLLRRSRRPPINGHTSSMLRHALRGVGPVKQLPK